MWCNSSASGAVPMQVSVPASVLPHDDSDPIAVLPVYAEGELGVLSTWVLNLELDICLDI
jgi:hypothetical protein